MTETQAIIDSYRRARSENVRAALATVVRVDGSAYRRPGVRMLITEAGETTGVISAGCLERDVCERAAKVMRTGKAVVVKYDTTSENDILWGSGSGCNGIVHVLIEPASNEIDDLMRFLTICSKSRRRGALATVIHQEGTSEPQIGTRALLYPDDATKSVFFSGEIISPKIFDDLREVIQNGNSKVKRYKEPGDLDVFIEAIEPQVQLVVFGAGDDALPIVASARTVGWHTTVVDTLARAISLERFGETDEVLLCRPEEVADAVLLTESTTVVLMTHNYLHDLELLKVLRNRPVRYIGCLGPRRRTERLVLELSSVATVADAFLSQLHSPAGLDIGAETPQEIALSIISEIKAVLAGHEGGLLRNRKGAIHTEVSEHTRNWPVSLSTPKGLRQLVMTQSG
jgi:xanthine dehydrogenase accessory factor